MLATWSRNSVAAARSTGLRRAVDAIERERFGERIVRRRGRRRGMRPRGELLQLVRREQFAATASLHFAAGGQRHASRTEQHDLVRVDVMLFDDRRPNRANDRRHVDATMLASHLVDDD